MNKMEKEKIIINICGRTGRGKSRITYLLKQFLKEKGFEINHNISDDFFTEEDCDNIMSANINDFVEARKDNTLIELNEITLTREYKTI
jgi:pantothenate kinase-related protein Tda10